MTTKICTKCLEEKELTSFHTSPTGKYGRKSQCKVCCNKAAKEDYHENKDRYFAHAKKRDKDMRDKIRALKSVPCADCDQSFDWVCMDFDHLPQFDKSHEISYMMRHRMAWDKILEEIAKCEVVCSNCHRLRSKSRWTTEEDFDGDF